MKVFTINRFVKYTDKDGRLVPNIDNTLDGFSMIRCILLASDPKPTDTKTFAN